MATQENNMRVLPGKGPAAREKTRPEVRINGVLYKLRFDLWALEQIEEKFGGIAQAFEALDGKGSMVKTAKMMFAIFANCQRNMDGMPETVTGDEISSHESMAKLKEITAAIRAAIRDGMTAETEDGGPASDKRANPLEKEYNAKNG